MLFDVFCFMRCVGVKLVFIVVTGLDFGVLDVYYLWEFGFLFCCF